MLALPLAQSASFCYISDVCFFGIVKIDFIFVVTFLVHSVVTSQRDVASHACRMLLSQSRINSISRTTSLLLF